MKTRANGIEVNYELHGKDGAPWLVVLPSAAHLANLEQPEGFSRALGDFLRTI